MLLKQSTQIVIPIFMPSSTDNITGVPGLTLTLTLKKQGESSFSSISPTVVSTGNGWYDVTLTILHTDTVGHGVLRATGLGVIPLEEKFQVMASLPDDVYALIDTEIAAIKTVVDTIATYVDTEVSAILAAVDAEVGAIKLRTDNLPDDPADASVVAALIAAVSAKVDAVDDYVDTELTAVKTVVDAIKVATDTITLIPVNPMLDTAIIGNLKKNTAVTAYPFRLIDSDGNPVVGVVATAVRKLDGGAFAACANAASATDARGFGTINLDAADMNGNIVSFEFTGAGALTYAVTEYTQR